MPVDYSKWDALELSDDSDIEVHPNVDKRSFIRAKQNQIHQQRFERKHRITTLKYEKVVNDGLLARIDALLKALESHKQDVEGKRQADEVDEVVFDCLVDVQGDGSLGEDQPPGAPEGVHSKEQQPSYSKMMGALVDQVKTEVDKSKVEGIARYEGYTKEIDGHLTKVQKLQKDLFTELNKLEKEEGSKITSESIHTGFDQSHVAKAKPAAAPTATAMKKPAKKAHPELLNAGAIDEAGAGTAGSEADIEDGALDVAPGEEDADDEDMEASPLAKSFAKLKPGDYQASLQFISAHPEILAEKETDGLLAEAFTSQSAAKTKSEEIYARQCVHQALLLQYCRQLGKDGVSVFFKRIQTQNHQAQKLFLDDVNGTYTRIRSRTAELNAQREEEGGERETIQLHAVDPNTTINIVTPPPREQCTNEDERTSRGIFDTFPPGLQRALVSGSLERVNEVLGKMSVSEAEEVVERLGEGGMLSLEAGVIDATTEEGKRAMEVIERTHQMPGDGGQEGAGAGEGGRVVEAEDEHMGEEDGKGGGKSGEKGLEEYLDEMD
ncbi:hsp90 co-chaperone Cdc37 [Friedmanniomyces endolithicus]|uniref:Hsp90 chaperone protein kinase-targeting subunit n=1 Tax=Friedmanniomyces endolithicus TaxID=329885 RepID=A0AAN6KSR3_9PEZI|nr:hsp90 co-chaperone Cdc37 [Friedmanniomyces endolithicus]KAK0294766.1 hsp90 co-chaperone Cdc37 [Friedmanniomyces endolithicus]KAK0322465.1 hsp90 co-chaperone Cdc37 [Friedmanniomyces endolithicus]KAK0922019.1 hsp90 co-chaperone Cdc37 [Friedmanniomyces endolithicus]KAK0972731.1 hsp90 co-chaperone Cdc37 [Friedmanniomyces endolithicus]